MEPSLGPAPAIVDTVFESLEAIRAQGRTILLVEQRATRAAGFADRSHVIANGTMRLSIDRTDRAECADDTIERIARPCWLSAG